MTRRTKASVRPVIQIEDQRAAAVHIGYELGQLVEGAGRAEGDNTYLESILIHARASSSSSWGGTGATPGHVAGGFRFRLDPAVERLRDRLPEIDGHLSHLS